MRSRLLKGLVFGSSLLLAVLAPGIAAAQVQVTPNFSVTPTKTVTPWIYQMAIGALILGALAILGVLASYLRFAPRFFARKEAPPKPAPGTRPALLSRPPTLAPAPARPAASTSAVAVAERPPPAPTAAAEAARAEAPARPTARPESEPAVQADAVGEAEAAAPEPRPSAKAPEETAAPAETAAPEPAAEQAPEPAPAPEAAEPAPAPAPSAGHGPTLDQETFDRVLEEQLGKGVDRRVAEGRARAAAVVAARKKAQG